MPDRTASPVTLWRRCAAIVYDTLAVIGIWFVVGGIVVGLHHGEAIPVQTPWFTALLLAATYAYFAFCWHRGGQTLGMKSWRIRVVDSASAAPISWRQTLVRFAVALVSWMPLGLGYFWALGGRGETWHDRASGSKLIGR